MTEDGLRIQEQIELIKNLKLTPDFIINIKVNCITTTELFFVFVSLKAIDLASVFYMSFSPCEISDELKISFLLTFAF